MVEPAAGIEVDEIALVELAELAVGDSWLIALPAIQISTRESMAAPSCEVQQEESSITF
jgi:hypothetical protein